MEANDNTPVFLAAVRNRDASYDGRFVYVVPSRKTYCRPSCDAVDTSTEVIMIYATPQDAEADGYVPCTTCSSPVARGSSRKVRIVEQICDYIRSNTSSDLSLPALERHFGLSRFTIQKSFKEIMGITPRKYVEECRINRLKQNLRDGEPMPQAVYKTGYNSQSWLYEDPASKLGMPPSSYRRGGEGATIRYLVSESKLGYLLVAETDLGICAISIADTEEQLEDYLSAEYPKASIIRSESVRERINSVLDYFEGQRLNLPVDVEGTEFQRRVWAVLRTIPYGETRSYNEVAEMIGMPRAYRAVANACAANPVPLVVPCHRVVRKNGGLGGYGLGIERKEFLLKMEMQNSGSD